MVRPLRLTRKAAAVAYVPNIDGARVNRVSAPCAHTRAIYGDWCVESGDVHP